MRASIARRRPRSGHAPYELLVGERRRHLPLMEEDNFRFVDLSDGRCCYRLDGPECGLPILLLHGATVPSWQFDRFVPLLADAGFRTIRADMFGHGYSERPECDYSIDIFVRQLHELIEWLDLRERTHVIGHSLGAAVAARLVAGEARRFDSAILYAPMLDFLATNPMLNVVRMPLLGELLMQRFVKPALLRRRTRQYIGIDDGRWVAMFEKQLAEPGFGRALLSMFRCGALGDQEDAYRSLGKSEVPVLVMYSENDKLVGEGQIRRLGQLMPSAEVHRLRGSGHGMLLAEPEAVAPAAMEFIRRASG